MQKAPGYLSLLDNTWWILKLNFKHIPFIAAARAIGYLNSYGSDLLRAFVTGLIIDWIARYVSNPTEGVLLVNSLFAFGGYYTLNGIAGVLRNYGQNMSGFKVSYEIPQNMLMTKLNALGAAALERPELQNLINRYYDNRYTIGEMSNSMFNLIGIIISLFFAITPLFALLPIISALLVAASLPAFFTNRSIIDKLWKLDKDTTVDNRRSAHLNGLLIRPETLKEIRMLNAYTYLKSYFDKYVARYFGTKLKLYNIWSAYDVLNTVLMGIVILLGIYSLINLAATGVITVGQIAFYLAALTSVSNYIDNFSSTMASYAGSSERLSEMRALLAYPEPAKDKPQLPEFQQPPLIQLKDVSFKYPGTERFILNNINLEIKPGEKIAIVGENGQGKTTLVKLISNIYPVTSGEILINDQNLNKVDEDSWFKNLGILYQDYNTYDDLTVFENIALGKIDKKVDYEKIKDAARKADAEEFIMAYENNYSQVLSERCEGGVRPSTGQWQKLAIARFFYREAPILILDEPTASIDAVAEANIFDRIYKFIQDRTVIIISHRFSTVRNASRIIVLSQGEIAEEGTHEELISKNGKYAHAFNLQADSYK